MSLEALTANADTSGLSVAGEIGQNELLELQKSLTAGYGTDVSQFTGGTAFRIQSLDTTLKATVQDNAHFALFNALAKPKATAVVDEWTEQTSIGGFLGGTYNDQDGDAMETNGEYARRTGSVKYMMTYRKVPIVLQHQNNMVDAVAIETVNGTKQLLTDIEYGLFENDDTVLPKSFAGLYQQIAGFQSGSNIIDMAGAPLNSIDPFSRAAEQVYGYGSFGQLTDVYLPPGIQSDLNMGLDPAFRVALDNSPNSVMLGTHVSGLRTSYGNIKTVTDVFIRDERMKKPFEVRNSIHAAVAVANVSFKPANFTAVAGAGAADSAWGSTHAGNYYYAVTGLNHNGETAALVSGVVAVTAGQQVTVTITASAGGTETGYVIYRSRKNGTNALTDLREMVKVAKAGATTTFVDKNRVIPGSTRAYALNLKSSDQSIDWKAYLPMMKIPMAAVRSPIIPWLQMICGYLRVTKRAHHIVFDNVVPTGAAWKPFV